jgi:predicted  nucleic acid-binding Zn-ribbon protein
MTDATATDEPHDDGSGAAGPPDDGGPRTVAHLLLELQAVDTQSDQLTYRREHTSALADLAEARSKAAAWSRERDVLQARLDGLGAAIEQAEASGATLLTHRQRLDQQLKTVIAPREAEALLHEIATIEAQRDELDVAELEALEEQAELDDRLTDHLAAEGPIAEAVNTADAVLTAEVAEIDAELADLRVRREPLIEDVPLDLRSTYDRKRAAFGVAVAALVGRQCQGCHLELSAAEIDTVKDEAAATGVTDCPECGRLLIV